MTRPTPSTPDAAEAEQSAASFEQLLLEEAARLAAVESEDIETRVVSTLGRVSQFFELDRFTLLTLDSTGTLRPQFSWVADGIPRDDELVGLSVPTRFPWLDDQLQNRVDLRIHDYADLPAVAKTERAYAAAHELKSTLFLPVQLGGALSGVFGFDCVRQLRFWDDTLVRRLRIACELAGNALARERAEQGLRQQLAFKRLVSELAASFVGGRSADLDARIQEALGRVCGALEADRSVVFVLDETPSLCVTHMWLEEDPRVAVAPGVKFEDIPWMTARCEAGDMIAVSSLDELPPEAVNERSHCAAAGILSTAVVPFSVGDEAVGGVTFDCRHRARSWPDSIQHQLRLVGEVIGSTLARTRAEAASREALLTASRQREELAHVTRVATLGEMTSSIAHEVNQPLTAISSNAGALLRMLELGTDDQGEIREALEDIVLDVKRAGDVILSLRSLVKKGGREAGPVDLNLVARDVERLVRSDALLQGIELDVEPAAEAVVRGDKVQLAQVVLNLVKNGCEAMRSAPAPRRVRIVVAGERRSEMMISVIDEGHGLTEGQRGRIFDPFFTTKEHGLGMGLPICRSIIEAHGGVIWAELNPDRGMTMHFRLPASQ